MQKHGVRIGFWYVLALLVSHVAQWMASTVVAGLTFAAMDLDGRGGALKFAVLYGIAAESFGRAFGNGWRGQSGPLWRRHLRMCWPLYVLGTVLFVGLVAYKPSLLHADMGGGIRFFRHSSLDRMLIRVRMVWTGVIPAMLLTNLCALAIWDDKANKKELH